LRISPLGGGSGIIDVIDFNMPKPNFHITRIMSKPTPTQTNVPQAGNEMLIMMRVLTN
jgi:hypothetical protein